MVNDLMYVLEDTLPTLPCQARQVAVVVKGPDLTSLQALGEP